MFLNRKQVNLEVSSMRISLFEENYKRKSNGN